MPEPIQLQRDRYAPVLLASRRSIVPVCTIAVALAVTSCGNASSSGSSSASTALPGARPAAVGNPLLAHPHLYADPDSAALSEAARLAALHRPEDAATMRLLSRQPTGIWFTGAPSDAARLRRIMQKADAARALPVIVAYNIPHRDCGQYSAGGAASPAAYRQWIASLARAIGRRQVVVVLEPDAIAHAVTNCVAPERVAERYRLLRFAVGALKANPRAAVYLDAGNPGFVNPVGLLAAPLRASGLAEADGFAINVGNFYETSRDVQYGTRLSNLVRRAHFVVDTGRNGNGPAPQPTDGSPKWCNPPGRALGRRPTTGTHKARVDAYLWVKPPGESDGACRLGEPPAGQWWTTYALELVKRSSRFAATG